MGCADHSPYNHLVRLAKNETKALCIIFTGLLLVVIANALDYDLPFRLIKVDDLIFFIHRFLFDSFLNSIRNREQHKRHTNSSARHFHRKVLPRISHPG